MIINIITFFQYYTVSNPKRYFVKLLFKNYILTETRDGIELFVIFGLFNYFWVLFFGQYIMTAIYLYKGVLFTSFRIDFSVFSLPKLASIPMIHLSTAKDCFSGISIFIVWSRTLLPIWLYVHEFDT